MVWRGRHRNAYGRHCTRRPRPWQWTLSVLGGTIFLYAQDNFTVAFSNPISAFGFFGTDIGDNGGQLTLTLTDTNGVISTLDIPHTLVSDGSTTGSNLYFGFYDKSTLYTQIVFGTSAPDADGFGIDNLSIGYATPLPTALPLFAWEWAA